MPDLRPNQEPGSLPSTGSESARPGSSETLAQIPEVIQTAGSPNENDDRVIKQQVRQFYDQVGWQSGSDGFYQNARYEDLRPVSRAYIDACHARVSRHLKPAGRFLLDGGSGPVQYPAYLAYSQGYQYRVCADISLVALREARRRLAGKGLYVVCDISRLPFKTGVFEGLVSLHTLHHLPPADHSRAYDELYRVLADGEQGVIVNGWTDSALMRLSNSIVKPIEWLLGLYRGKGRQAGQPKTAPAKPSGTFIQKYDAAWLKKILEGKRFQILTWRSVNVRFLRTVIHQKLGGALWLKILFWFEERFPHFFGKYGQYPLIVICKNGSRA